MECPSDMPTGQSDRGKSSAELLPSQVTLYWMELMKFYSVCQVLHYYILKEVSLECFPIYLVFAYVWMLGGAYLWRSGDNLWESSLSYHVGPVDQTEARLGDKHSRPPGTSPALIFFCTAFISGYLFLSLELTLHVYWLIWLPLSSPCSGHSY